MLRLRQLLWSMVLLPAAAGCADPHFGLPHLFDNLPEWARVAEAKRFDPYPDPNIGPDVVGGRPLAYLHPRPDPDPNKDPRFYLPQTPAVGYPPLGATYPAAPGYYPSGYAGAAPGYPPTSYPAASYAGAPPLGAPPMSSPAAVVSMPSGGVSYPTPGGYSAPISTGSFAPNISPAAASQGAAYGTAIKPMP